MTSGVGFFDAEMAAVLLMSSNPSLKYDEALSQAIASQDADVATARLSRLNLGTAPAHTAASTEMRQDDLFRVGTSIRPFQDYVNLARKLILQNSAEEAGIEPAEIASSIPPVICKYYFAAADVNRAKCASTITTLLHVLACRTLSNSNFDLKRMQEPSERDIESYNEALQAAPADLQKIITETMSKFATKDASLQLEPDRAAKLLKGTRISPTKAPNYRQRIHNIAIVYALRFQNTRAVNAPKINESKRDAKIDNTSKDRATTATAAASSQIAHPKLDTVVEMQKRVEADFAQLKYLDDWKLKVTNSLRDERYTVGNEMTIAVHAKPLFTCYYYLVMHELENTDKYTPVLRLLQALNCQLIQGLNNLLPGAPKTIEEVKKTFYRALSHLTPTSIEHVLHMVRVIATQSSIQDMDVSTEAQVLGFMEPREQRTVHDQMHTMLPHLATELASYYYDDMQTFIEIFNLHGITKTVIELFEKPCYPKRVLYHAHLLLATLAKKIAQKEPVITAAVLTAASKTVIETINANPKAAAQIKSALEHALEEFLQAPEAVYLKYLTAAHEGPFDLRRKRMKEAQAVPAKPWDEASSWKIVDFAKALQTAIT